MRERERRGGRRHAWCFRDVVDGKEGNISSLI
jgi:hypothetical protein